MDEKTILREIQGINRRRASKKRSLEKAEFKVLSLKEALTELAIDKDSLKQKLTEIYKEGTKT